MVDARADAGRRTGGMNVTEVLAQAVERHHPRLVMLCSFQKEESVLVDELVRLAPDARIVTIDTGVLFPETLATWRAFEQRFGVDIEIEDATGDWTGPAHCCGERKVAALERALGGVDAWITGIRREQSPDARQRAAGRVGRQARRCGSSTRSSSGPRRTSGGASRARPAVQPAARSGLRVDRLRALHQPGHRPRGPLGGPVQDRVRAARVTAITPPALSHLRALEAEAIHVMREVAAEREKPALLFSGGKDSIVLVRLAQKAFAPGKVPFPLLHIDTGHNFPEVIAFRDRLVAEHDLELLVGSVQASIDAGRVREETGPRASRNRLQTVTLLDAIESTSSTPASAAPAATRSAPAPRSACSSFRDDFGTWDPRRQRPELWDLYNARVRRGENIRAFPISNWTELDVWQYIAHEELELPSIYMAHEREVFARDGMLYAVSPYIELMEGEEPFTASVRYRTVGDMSCTGAVRSTARTLPEVVAEIAATNITERGETRADDRAGEAAMEDRKKEGYF